MSHSSVSALAAAAIRPSSHSSRKHPLLHLNIPPSTTFMTASSSPALSTPPTPPYSPPLPKSKQPLPPSPSPASRRLADPRIAAISHPSLTSRYSLPAPSPEQSPAAPSSPLVMSDIHDIFTTLAHKERRVLEAREMLEAAELDLESFRHQWSTVLTAAAAEAQEMIQVSVKSKRDSFREQTADTPKERSTEEPRSPFIPTKLVLSLRRRSIDLNHKYKRRSRNLHVNSEIKPNFALDETGPQSAPLPQLTTHIPPTNTASLLGAVSTPNQIYSLTDTPTSPELPSFSPVSIAASHTLMPASPDFDSCFMSRYLTTITASPRLTTSSLGIYLIRPLPLPLSLSYPFSPLRMSTWMNNTLV